ncbi:MAG: radical SAM protein [Desulfobacterales bacterium]|nr:radical SAM protein [Desulfobacterales bacterium]
MRGNKIHRNITVKRLALDFIQFLRCQRPLVYLFGNPFQRSRHYIEIDITYRCNLMCLNCNRSCTQSPSPIEMPVATIVSFIDQSIASGATWRRIRLLGGEPTLHTRFFDIIELLRAYRTAHNPELRIVVCTNGCGAKVQRRLQQLPADIAIKNTSKLGGQRLFRPFNRAPVDSRWNRFADFSCGCRILGDCGIGLTPMGYYACAVAGGIDRIFEFNVGRPQLPEPGDDLENHLRLFCRYCGHFGFQWPTKQAKMSPVWQKAYRRCNMRRPAAP